MSELTKQALKVDNNQSFPNNNAGLITPTALRAFNENMIDSTVNQTVYTTDSGSFNSRINAITGSATNTGSLLTTASAVGNVMTFTKGDASTFNVTVGSVIPSGTISGSQQITQLGFVSSSVTGSSIVTASFAAQTLTFTKGDGSQFGIFIPDNSGSVLPSGVVSGSSQINYPQISNIPAGIVSGSSQITPLLPTGVVSGSSQISYPQISNIPSGIVSGSSQLTSSYDTRYVLSGSVQPLPSGVVSGSSQIILQQTTGNLSGSRIDGLVVSASNALTASEARNVVIIARNGNPSTLPAGTVVHITSAVGDNPVFTTASYDNEALSSNTLGILRNSAPSGADVEVVVNGVVVGVNTNPALGFAAGDIIYLSSGGGFTRVQPQAPNQIVALGQVLRAQQNNGSIYVSINNGWELNELHNVQITSPQTNQLLAYESASYGLWKNKSTTALGIPTTGSNTFTGTQTFQNIIVNGTASINYLQTVTGSAKVIGDAFIILNNNTPTERYAGIIVLDSGSAGTSASFQFDGQTNDWFYEYTGSDPLNFGVALFGPEYGTKGSPIYPTNNRIVKGDGGHHILDSNISDDGSTVSINSNTQVTGSLSVNGQSVLVGTDLAALNAFTTSIQAEVDNLQSVTGSYATTGSNTFVGNQVISGSTTITGELSVTPALLPNGFPAGIGQFIIPFLSGSTNVIARDSDNALYWQPAFNVLAVSSSTANSTISPGGISLTSGTTGSTQLTTTRITSNFGAGRNISIAGDAESTALTGLTGITNPSIILQSGSAGLPPQYYAPIQFQASQSFTDGRVTITRPLVGLEGAQITGSVSITGNITASLQEGFVLVGNAAGRTTTVATSSFVSTPTDLSSLNAFTASAEIRLNNLELETASLESSVTNLNAFTSSQQGLNGTFATTGSNTFVGNQIINGNLTASLQQGYVWVGNASGVTTTVSTGSFGGGGGGFPFTGNAVITGSLGISGSMFGGVVTLSVASSTASVNFGDANMFTITLPTGSVTHITPSNIRRGQTINIQISQASGASTGSVTFSPNVLFAGGADYQATATGSAIDLLTLVSLDGTNVLAASIRNFQ